MKKDDAEKNGEAETPIQVKVTGCLSITDERRFYRSFSNCFLFF